jgi:malonate transporter MadM subunit
MEKINALLLKTADRYDLVVAFAVVGIIVWISYFLSNKFTSGRIHGSAIAIVFGLLAAYLGGVITGGKTGIADLSLMAGIGIMGGNMLRDFAIVATAFGVRLGELKESGIAGVISIIAGVIVSFVVGAIIAVLFGYTDAVSITTIGAGAVTYIVGPVTGAALGAGSEVIALSIAAGLVKSMFVMVGTPMVARHIGLDNPQSAMVFGGLMGTTSGVAGGLAATDPRLVPYGAMTATFYTGFGCLLAPSLLFLIVRALT